jgi:glyoxylate/hydroxypyruvate reductase
VTILYRSDPERGRQWARIFAEQAPDLEFRMWPEVGDPAVVDYAVVWAPPPGFLESFPNLKVIFSTGAGVDHIDFSALPDNVPIVRMVEPGIVGTMVEYVTMAALALHRNLVDYVDQQRRREWRSIRVFPASERQVGVMGLGVLGQAALHALGQLGFRRSGWSRSPKQVDGVACYVGGDQLESFLAECDILVCLLPLTSETRGLLNAATFAALPQGAGLINAGRGGHLVEPDLLAALDSGQIGAAVLDVFSNEPLPADHIFWTHPRILITPHVASMTQPQTSAAVVLDNVRRHQRGEPLKDVVDRRRGY